MLHPHPNQPTDQPAKSSPYGPTKPITKKWNEFFFVFENRPRKKKTHAPERKETLKYPTRVKMERKRPPLKTRGRGRGRGRARGKRTVIFLHNPHLETFKIQIYALVFFFQQRKKMKKKWKKLLPKGDIASGEREKKKKEIQKGQEYLYQANEHKTEQEQKKKSRTSRQPMK